MTYIALLQTHIFHGTGILTYIYHKIPTIHVGKYTVRPMGWYGKFNSSLPFEHHPRHLQKNQHLKKPKHLSPEEVSGVFQASILLKPWSFSRSFSWFRDSFKSLVAARDPQMVFELRASFKSPVDAKCWWVWLDFFMLKLWVMFLREGWDQNCWNCWDCWWKKIRNNHLGCIKPCR